MSAQAIAQEFKLVFVCTQCNQQVPCNPMAFRLLTANGKCQACRLTDTLDRVDIHTANAIVDYMETHGWPKGMTIG